MKKTQANTNSSFPPNNPDSSPSPQTQMSSRSKGNLFQNILSWIAVAFFALLAIGGSGSAAMIIFGLMAVSFLPLKPIRNLWSKITGGKRWIKPLGLVAAFFLGISLVPTPPSETPAASVAIDMESESAEETFAAASQSMEENGASGIQSVKESDTPKIQSAEENDTSETQSAGENDTMEAQSAEEKDTQKTQFAKENDMSETQSAEDNSTPGTPSAKANDTPKTQFAKENDTSESTTGDASASDPESILPADQKNSEEKHDIPDVSQKEAVTPASEATGTVPAPAVTTPEAAVPVPAPAAATPEAAVPVPAPAAATPEAAVPVPAPAAPAVQPGNQTVPAASSAINGVYAVNGKNGKVHIVGQCNATNPSSKNFMDIPIPFATLEEAEAHSRAMGTAEEKIHCKNCW